MKIFKNIIYIDYFNNTNFKYIFIFKIFNFSNF